MSEAALAAGFNTNALFLTEELTRDGGQWFHFVPVWPGTDHSAR